MRRHTPEEIGAKLSEAASLAAAGRTQSDIAQALGISVMTFHRWRKSQPRAALVKGGRRFQQTQLTSAQEPSDAAPGSTRLTRVSELQTENRRLRKVLVDLLLEKAVLEEQLQSALGRK